MISGKQSTAFFFTALACCMGITAPILSAKTKSLMIADLNGDGKPDIITEDDQGRFYWNKNTLYSYRNWAGQIYRGGSIYRRAKIYPDTITISVEKVGSGDFTGTGEHQKSTNVTLTAYPALGHEFLGWLTPPNTYLDSSTTRTVSVSEDTTYRAIFSPIVNIPDPKLEAAIRRQLGWSNRNHSELGAYLNTYPTHITQAHMELLTYDMWVDDVANLEGIQYTKNLGGLHLYDLKTTDPSPLWNLTNLRALEMEWGGRITSIQGIEKLTKLENLELDGQRLTDISPLRDLTNLRYLDIEENLLDLSDPKVQSDIKSLRDRGVDVDVGFQLSKAVQDLQGEMATLRGRLASDPNDAQANFLYALELILNLAEDQGTQSLKATAIAAGVSDSITSFVLPDLWLEDTDHNFTLNRNFDLNDFAEYGKNTFLSTLATIDGHLSKVTSTNTPITLSQDETGVEDEVFVDHGDALVIRAGLKVISGFIKTLVSYDWSMNAGKAEDLDEKDQVSMETVRDANPTMGSLKTNNLLASAKQDFKDAVSLYKQGSEIVRGRMNIDRLMNVESEDLEDEAEFREELDEFLAALDSPHNFDEEKDPNETVNLSRLFASAVDFAKLFPESVGDKFVSSEVTDPTFGGLLPNWTASKVDQEMKENDLLAEDIWEGAKSVTNAPNWRASHWWGEFYRPMNYWGQPSSNWIYHFALGWVYPMATNPGDMWFWQGQGNSGNWLWTNKQVYPYVYSHSENAWLYLFTNSRKLVIWRGSSWEGF
jgi:hypothetical protein